MANWNRALPSPLHTKDGRTIATLADGRDLALSLPEEEQGRQAWQRAARLMLEAADGGDIGAAALQLETALFLSYRMRLGD